MKPAPFDYARPASVDEAVKLMEAADGGAKIMAGGQSLGPTLNLRLTQPDLVVDVTAIAALTGYREEDDHLVYGACITHASMEDGRVPDATNGFLRRVAEGIAYRAVRNRGTIGGSLGHADPAADWITTLSAVDAEVLVCGPKGERCAALAEGFMTGPFSVALDDAEFITGIRVARYSPRARFGYFKFCRKRGEFAEAMTAIVIDPEREIKRAVIGATDSAPIVIDDIGNLLRGSADSVEEAKAMVMGLEISGDPVRALMHANAFVKALQQVAP